MLFTRKPRQRPDFDKFPAQQLFILALIRVSEPIALTSIFPYAWKLVLHFNVGERSNASFYAGILISAFSLAEALTGMYWGALSDRVGRKPILLLGCAGTVLSLIIVGLSPNFWVALAGRALGGFLNGNIGVIQTMVGELTVNPKHEPKAYAVMPFVWSIGTIIGPSIGGYFAAPADTYPDLFPRDGVFDNFPYLLPNIICAGMMIFSIVAGWFLLDETHPDMQPWSTASDLAKTSAVTPHIPTQASTTTAAADLTQESSYGTFNNVQVDTIEEWTVHPDGKSTTVSAPPSIAEKVLTRQVVMLIVALGIFTYHSMTFDHLLPIYLQDQRVDDITTFSHNPLGGGLGLTIQQVGVICSVNGLIALFVQAVVFPLVASWLGVWRTFLVVTVLHPLSYAVVPGLSLLPDGMVYPGIYAVLTLRNMLSILAYPLLLILIKEAAPSHGCLGRINGLAASTGAACRCIASPVAGALYGVGVKVDCTAIAWWGSAVVAMIGAGQAMMVRRERMGARRGSVHHIGAAVGRRGSLFLPQEQVAEVVHVRVQRVNENSEEEEVGERSRLLA